MGYGPIHLGMSRSQIEKLYGEKLDRFSDYQESCLEYRPRGGYPIAGITFILNRDRLARIDFNKMTVSHGPPDAVVDVESYTGVRIGDPAEKIETIYGKAAIKTAGRGRHAGEVLYTIASTDKRNLIRYFVGLSGTVGSFRVGRRHEVLNVDHCRGSNE